VSTDTQMTALMTVLLLVLPLSALIARRVPIGRTLGLAAIWAVIFAVALVVVTMVRDQDFKWSRLLQATGLSDQQVVGRTVVIPIDPDGYFRTTIRINGVSRRVLIDSGATVTSISPETARAAGLNLDEEAFPRIVDTANGQTMMRVATVKSLRLGTIEARNLRVFVGNALGGEDLLGMNFLSRLKGWRVEGNRMILEPRTASDI